MSDLSEKQVQELFTENLKKAVSRCCELGDLTSNKSWGKVAQQLTLLRKKGEAMYQSRSMSKLETERQIDAHVARMVANNEALH